MKIKYIFPCFAVVSSLFAQEPPAQADPVKRVSPPKAQVIEEEDSEGSEVIQQVAVDLDNSNSQASSEASIPPTVPSSISAEALTEAPTIPAELSEGSQVSGGSQSLDPSVVSEVVESTTNQGVVLGQPLSEDEKQAAEGIQIQVEQVSSPSGSGIAFSDGEVKVYSPWTAKPLSAPPVGWKYIPAPKGIQPYRTTVKLTGDRSVDLSITPYILVPVGNGRNVIRIAEPGYESTAGYSQTQTIGSILMNSTEEIEHNEKLTGAAIQRLQRLLSSLPQ